MYGIVKSGVIYLDPKKRKYIAIGLLIIGALLIGMRFDVIEGLLTGKVQFSGENLFAIMSPLATIILGVVILAKK